MIARKAFAALAVLAVLSVAAVVTHRHLTAVVVPPDAPNIVLIVADDLGWSQIEPYGQTRIATPRLQALADGGMVFDQFYAGSTVCAPSRATLMEGRTNGFTSIRGNPARQWGLDPDGKALINRYYRERTPDTPLPPASRTIADMLHERGYATAVIGKWGLGGAGDSGDPLAQGFDRFYGLATHIRAHNHYPAEVWRDREVERTGNPDALVHLVFDGDPTDLTDPAYREAQGEQWFGDLIAREAAAFIARNADQRFFLYVPMTAPHAALQAPPDSVAAYDGVFEETPYVNPGPAGGYVSRPNPRALFAAMVSRMDRNVGEIEDALIAAGVRENTLILFTSDNGPSSEGGVDVPFFNGPAPLRGEKRDLYEGGIRVPLIANWPARIAPGTRTAHVSAFWDLAPTFAALTGGPDLAPTDGLSLTPTLLGDAFQPTHEALYWEFHESGGARAVRAGRWKAVWPNMRHDVAAELYDLEADPQETTDLATARPDVLDRIEAMLPALRAPSDTRRWNF